MMDQRPNKTYNVRLTDQTIVELDELVMRFNTDLGLSAFGHIYTRADVLRTVIKNGISATQQSLIPPPSPKPTTNDG